MLKHLVVLLVFSLILISCGEKKNEPENKISDKEKYTFDSTDLKTDGVDNTGKPFFLKYKFVKGDKAVYRLTTIANNTQTITMDSAMSQSVNQ
ncbi:MAG TPA: hypothetical protein PLH53_12005, partial [Ignavibacteriaceae bacterium]|nr:hypothetical protein [Ignavibacteriaceae bacterium]